MNENEVVAPWYRQPWLWFCLAIPMTAIVWGLTMLVFASSLDTSMVTDDYAKQGRGYNMSVARDELAREMQMAGTLAINGRSAELLLETEAGPADFPYLVLKLYHPTQSDQDRIIQFQQRASGEYAGQVHEDLDGRWYYDLQGPSGEWRVKGEFRLPVEDSIEIKALDSAKG